MVQCLNEYNISHIGGFSGKTENILPIPQMKRERPSVATS